MTMAATTMATTESDLHHTRSCTRRIGDTVIRSVALLCLLALTALPLAAEDGIDVNRLVELLNPYQNVDIAETSGFFGEPVSDIAKQIKTGAWFSFLVFLPFLVLPQVLLLIIIFRFKDKGKKGATFTHNNRLEIIWTAIPVLALIVVMIPITPLLYHQESPPVQATRGADAFSVEVIGKQFAWDYNYPDQDISVGSYPVRDLPPLPEGAPETSQRMASVQEPAVFIKDRPVTLFLKSNDVNHAWWVPAFGVKKDTYIDRHTHTWFTPLKTGYYEGACAELCGQGHGIMKINAVVLEEEDFKIWVYLKIQQKEANVVVGAIRSGEGADAAVSEYLAVSDTAKRRDALRFWMAYDGIVNSSVLKESAANKFGSVPDLAAREATIAQRNDQLEQLISQVQTSTTTNAMDIEVSER
jgi:cytochrome c oxidase subunit 2